MRAHRGERAILSLLRELGLGACLPGFVRVVYVFCVVAFCVSVRKIVSLCFERNQLVEGPHVIFGWQSLAIHLCFFDCAASLCSGEYVVPHH